MLRGMGRDQLVEEGDDVRTAEQLTPHDRCRLEHPAGLAGVPIADYYMDALHLAYRGKHAPGLGVAGLCQQCTREFLVQCQARRVILRRLVVVQGVLQ